MTVTQWLWFVIGIVGIMGLVYYLFRMQENTLSPQQKPNLNKRADFEVGEEFLIHPELNYKSPKLTPETDSDLPMAYDETTLVALAKDPRTIYCYWEISATFQEDFLRSNPDVSWEDTTVLRLYDQRGEVRQSITLDTFATSWYLSCPESNLEYVVELGKVSALGLYRRLLSSNPVHVPRQFMSNEIDSDWLPIKECLPSDFKGLHFNQNLSSAGLIKKN